MIKLIKDLVETLNKYNYAYENGNPLISDAAYDKLYFELKSLEEKTGIVLGNSPTQKINYEVVNALQKVEHNHPMLSLDKTKDINDIAVFLGARPFLAMLKMDGLTCSLCYENGELVSAETRGNGIVGEDILHNARVISSIPQKISYTKRLIIDGEIICTYKDFENFKDEYKNPRNFAAGSIRLLDPKESYSRKLTFVAWDIIEGFEETNFLDIKLDYLTKLGFNIVPSIYYANKAKANFDSIINTLKKEANDFSYPYDGFVFKFNEYSYRKIQGTTAHHAKDAIALKEYDEEYESTLIDIEWSVGRTGQITPIAVFDPIDMDGSSIVERASLHNITVMNSLSKGYCQKGDKVKVIKSNMIIPQIVDWEHLDFNPNDSLEVPTSCPICGHPTSIVQENDSQVLICENLECEARFINQLEYFVSKKGLDIKGLSKATLEKLVEWGWVETKIDLFNLEKYRNEWIDKPGFGPKSVDKLLENINLGRHTTLEKFITSLGIPLIGSSMAKELVKYFNTWEEFIAAAKGDYKFYNLNTFGIEKHNSLKNYDYNEACYLADNYIKFIIPEEKEQNKSLNNINFVITGKLVKYKREELKNKIEDMGGKVLGAVSKNTTYLICNEKNSTSSKMKAALAAGVEVLTEDEFIKKFDFS